MRRAHHSGLKVLLLAAVVALPALLRGAAPAAANFGYTAVSVGDVHTCALTSAGGVRCWGNNQYGQLGDGSSSPYNYDRPAPADVAGLTSGVVAITSGFNFTCALMDAGDVKCWGQNGGGTLGDGTFIDRSAPVDVQDLPTSAVAIAAGGANACAVLEDTTLWCWGNNYQGQLGNGTASNEDPPNIYIAVPGPVCADASCSAPLTGVAAVAVGGHDSCALVEDDPGTPGYAVKCWGGVYHDEVANPGPADVCGNLTGNYCTTTPKDIAALPSGVASIVVGDAHKCVLTTAGGVKCWGNNFVGQLGNNIGTVVLTPEDVIAHTSGIAKIEADSSSNCAIHDDGALTCWGNYFLGDGTAIQHLVPRAVCVDAACSGPFASAVDVSLGSYSHACALNTQGFVKCWGYNFHGQLGDGHVDPFDAPALTPHNLAQDSDGDGCPDLNEIQTQPGSESHGGRRDPKNAWDFFDPTRDGRMRIDDVLTVLAHFSQDVGEGGYASNFDRTFLGPNAWNLGPPDGHVTIVDVLMILRLYGQDCVPLDKIIGPHPS